MQWICRFESPRCFAVLWYVMAEIQVLIPDPAFRSGSLPNISRVEMLSNTLTSASSHLSSSLLPSYLQRTNISCDIRLLLATRFYSFDLFTTLALDLAKATYTLLHPSASKAGKACEVVRVLASPSTRSSSEQIPSKSHIHRHYVKSSQSHRRSAGDNQCR